MTIAPWDPRLHPRDVRGRFRSVVPGLFDLDPPGEFVYHVADDEVLDSISIEGLEPRVTSMVNEADYPGVYFWSDVRDARSWQRKGQSVLRVRKSDLELEPDLSGSSLDIEGKAFRSRAGVPANIIDTEEMSGGSYANTLLNMLWGHGEGEPGPEILDEPDPISRFKWIGDDPYWLERLGNPETIEAARWLRDRRMQREGPRTSVVEGDFDTLNRLQDEVDKWPRLSPEKGGASPRVYGLEALMQSVSEVITARGPDGKLVGVGTFEERGDMLEGGTFAALPEPG